MINPIITPITLASPRSFVAPRLIRMLNGHLVVPAFSAPSPGWAGSSHILARGIISMDSTWSIVTPVLPISSFVAAVRWGETRRKLWRDVGEILSYPLYGGETLPASGTVLEIWSVESYPAGAMSAAQWNVPITKLEAPTDHNDVTTVGVIVELCITNDGPEPTTLDEFLAKCPPPE